MAVEAPLAYDHEPAPMLVTVAQKSGWTSSGREIERVWGS